MLARGDRGGGRPIGHPLGHRTAVGLGVRSWLLGAILALAAGLRWLRRDGSSLWSDEGNSWAMLRRGFGAIATAAAQDIHPPGYYRLLKA